jgi:hypothetical protein
MRLGHASACLGDVDLRSKFILPTAELHTEQRISNHISSMRGASLFNSLHLCYAELVCVLVDSEKRKVAAIVDHQQPRSKKTPYGKTYTASATSLAICMREHVAENVPEMRFGGSLSFGGQLPKNGSKSGCVTNGTGMAWEFTNEQNSRPTYRDHVVS